MRISSCANVNLSWNLWGYLWLLKENLYTKNIAKKYKKYLKRIKKKNSKENLPINCAIVETKSRDDNSESAWKHLALNTFLTVQMCHRLFNPAGGGCLWLRPWWTRTRQFCEGYFETISHTVSPALPLLTLIDIQTLRTKAVRQPWHHHHPYTFAASFRSLVNQKRIRQISSVARDCVCWLLCVCMSLDLI